VFIYNSAKTPSINAVEDFEFFQSPTPQHAEIKEGITSGEFAAFIGGNAGKYLRKFNEFYVDGKDKFTFTWHWPAFLFGFFWMVYRKLYGWAFVLLFLQTLFSLIPYLSPVARVVIGLIGNYLYYKHTKEKILKLKKTHTFSDSAQMVAALKKIGAVNVRALIICIILTPVVLWLSLLL